MRIAIVANDTRGGTQPYVALGLGLKAAGHDVQMVAPADFASMFAEAGLPLAPLSGSVEAALRNSDGAAERGAWASMRFVARELPAHLENWTRETYAACAGAEIITGGVGGMVVGLAVAEKLGVPFVEAHLQPVRAPSADYPGVMFSGTPRWLGGWAMRLSHHLSEQAIWLPFRGAMNKVRERVLGLKGTARPVGPSPVLYGFSPRVVALPQSNDRVRMATGYWFLPSTPSWQPPPSLTGFLARSGPVISIGFGSMSSDDPQKLTDLVLGAIRKAGVRAVLLSGWGGLASASENSDVLIADALPHDWLFPRMAATVHHGGAGTTGAALRAGVPQVIVPFTMDQPFWASRVKALGVGPAPISRKVLSETRLADALQQALNQPRIREHARELGAQIRQEEGVAIAVRAYERLASQAKLD